MIRLLPLSLLGLSACVINGDAYPRPRDLPPGWLVDRTRILAIQADPPELRPGESAQISALIPDPDGTISQILWLGCRPEQATGFGCAVNFADLPENPTPQDLIDAGIIGFEPGLPPVLTAPADVLDGVDEATRRNGVYMMVQAMALPPETDGSDLDFGEVESGYKRVVVSEDPALNHNPDVAAMRVDGIEVPSGAPVTLDANQTYDLEAVLVDGAIESYAYLNPEGVEETREEEPYVLWYATGGDLWFDTSLAPYLYTTWTSPAEPGVEGTVWAVVRDRRGGIAWFEQPFVTR